MEEDEALVFEENVDERGGEEPEMELAEEIVEEVVAEVEDVAEDEA